MDADMLNRRSEDRPPPPSLSLSLSPYFLGGERPLRPLWICHCI
jgi:hypothetical protein